MIVLIWILNFVISWINAWGCGKSWAETTNTRGFAHFMNWMAAIMSACGFTWCYLILLASIGTAVPLESEDGGQTAYLVTPEILEMSIKLGYSIIILPILGSGFAITLASWARFYRNRSIGNGAVAGYNTLAMAYDTMNAVHLLPEFVESLTGFFKGAGKGSDDKKSGAILIVVLLVVLAMIGGILTTRAIILSTARRVAGDMRWRFAQAEEPEGVGTSPYRLGYRRD
ncbi:MAG: hypothetical protein RL141_175 [Candidatus Parcubacteria bacterium]